MISRGYPGGTQVEGIHPGDGNTPVPGFSKQLPITGLLTCKELKADTRLAIADCWTGNDWKT